MVHVAERDEGFVLGIHHVLQETWWSGVGGGRWRGFPVDLEAVGPWLGCAGGSGFDGIDLVQGLLLIERCVEAEGLVAFASQFSPGRSAAATPFRLDPPLSLCSSMLLFHA